MASELRKTILEIEDTETEIVEVPQWGGAKIEVRSMTGAARGKFMKRVATGDGGTDFEKFYAELIIATAFDPETGEKVFEDADRDALNKKSGAALQLLADPALRLSGLGGEAVEAAVADFGETPRTSDGSS